VLLADNVADLWHAADRGALQRLRSSNLEDVPATLRDPDSTWVATEVRVVSIAINRKSGDPDINTFDDLASEEMHGKLCLESSASSFSRSLMALLISDIGEKPAERLVRRWVGNLAVPPLASGAEVLAAVHSGTCTHGILAAANDDDFATVVSQTAYFDISGAGVARHSTNPESAHQFLEWIIDMSVETMPVVVDRQNIAIAGWRDQDASLLAERAGYR